MLQLVHISETKSQIFCFICVSNSVMARAWYQGIVSGDCPGNPGIKLRGKTDAVIHDEQVEGEREGSLHLERNRM